MTLGRFTDLDDAGPAERTARLEKERREVIDTFLSGDRLTRMPAQKRKRSVVLEYFACLFEPGRTYEEPEVNDLITPLFPDYCLVRRLLIDEGYLVRADQVYRRTDRACSRPAGARRYTITERRDMDDTKKALKRRYKLEGRPAGIFRVRNDVTGKVFVGSSLDLNSPLNRIEFELQHGISRNRELQEDYGRYGRKSFTFEIVEVLDPAGDPAFTVERRLEELEQAYAANLDRTNSYNTKERLRFP